MFYIGFTSAAQTDEEGRRHAQGELTLDRDRAGFQSDLGSWSMREYEAHWRDAIARLMSGKSSSLLVTSYRGPGAGHHVGWPIWREGPTACFQERIFFADELPGPFDPATAYELVGERTTIDEDGDRRAEWRVPLAQLAAFLMDR